MFQKGSLFDFMK